MTSLREQRPTRKAWLDLCQASQHLTSIYLTTPLCLEHSLIYAIALNHAIRPSGLSQLCFMSVRLHANSVGQRKIGRCLHGRHAATAET